MANYCTIAEFKDQVDKTTSTDDVVIEQIIAAASLAIDNYCNRKDGFLASATATARTFAGSGTVYQWIDECAAVTLVAVKESVTDTTYTAWAATDWLAFAGDPEMPDFNRTPYTGLLVDPSGDQTYFISGRFNTLRGFRPDPDSLTRGRGAPTVQVTAKWGYSLTVPATIRQACITQSARWYKRGLSSWGDALGNADFGMVMYRKAIDPDIQMMLQEGRYVKPAIGVR